MALWFTCHFWKMFSNVCMEYNLEELLFLPNLSDPFLFFTYVHDDLFNPHFNKYFLFLPHFFAVSQTKKKTTFSKKK